MQIVERSNRKFVVDGIVNDEVRSRNFGGEERKDRVTGRTVNSQGRRNFLLYITDEMADELSGQGVEIKMTRPQNPNDIPRPYVSVTISYYLKPVEAYIIANEQVTSLDEGHIYQLNDVDIKNMCMEIEFGKEKAHLNGDKYVPLFAQRIWVEIVPSYINSRYGHLMPGASPIGASTTEQF